MKYFSQKEFHGFYHVVCGRLCVKLDKLREELNCPLRLSNIPDGIARYGGESKSQHNLDRWNETRAVDGYIPDSVSYKQFFDACVKVGFTGIGLYKGWGGGRGFHVDVRDSANGHIAKWSGHYDILTRKTEYKKIDELLTEE